jgi:hypothetical protein
MTNRFTSESRDNLEALLRRAIVAIRLGVHPTSVAERLLAGLRGGPEGSSYTYADSALASDIEDIADHSKDK